jgi:hypothetical protein
MGHIARTQTGRMARIIALGATLLMAGTASALARLDAGALRDEGFTHTSLIDGTVLPTLDSLVGVYIHLQDVADECRVDDRMACKERDQAGGSVQSPRRAMRAAPSAACDEGKVERETGLEPATFCLGSRHSTD